VSAAQSAGGGTGMYRVSLTESFFPAVQDEAVEKLTIGDLVRRQAKAHAGTVALKELAYDGAIGRTWNTHRRLCQQPSRMGLAGIGFGNGRDHAGHGQSGVPGARA
jgi:hypothetical protein